MLNETWPSQPKPTELEVRNKAAVIFADQNKAYLLKVIEAAIAAENMTADAWRNQYSDQYRQDRDTHFPGWTEEDFRTVLGILNDMEKNGQK